jgi:membrane-bound inhibitor of C-type lysozyme
MKYIIFLLLLLIIGGGAYLALQEQDEEAPVITTNDPSPKPVATVDYVCNNKATINAAYFENAVSATSTDQLPVPAGSVKVTLSDERVMTLVQTISASGVRYSNGDPQVAGAETFVFWSKGDSVIFLEDNEEKNYVDCIAVAPFTIELPNIYHDGENGFTVRYPNGWKINSAYKNPATGASLQNFHDLKFVIPDSQATGTNLSSGDSGVSIEMAQTEGCSAAAFTDQSVIAATTTINGIEYSLATSSDAGAGNFYEEFIYALPTSKPCIAIHYLIHSTNIDNYEPDTVTAFNRTGLLKQFDGIRDSFRLAQ